MKNFTGKLRQLFKNMANNSYGKFIVIDGTDGSGKATQLEMLTKALKNEGFEVENTDFPQYSQKSAGAVEEYLNGKYGSAEEVGPYRASIFYAIDRYDGSFKIEQWLKEGKIVISNRYVSANMGHQGGKIKDSEERKKYLEWLHELEHKIFKIPQPDMNIILHVDSQTAQKLVDKKGERQYLKNKKRDIHEADLEHLKNAEKVYLEMANNFPGFQLLKCTNENGILSKEKIHKMLYETVKRVINSQ